MLRCANLQLRESQQQLSQEDSASTDGEEELTNTSGSRSDALIYEDNEFIIAHYFPIQKSGTFSTAQTVNSL